MVFDPAAGALKCSYCGTAQAVSRAVNEGVTEIPFELYADRSSQVKLSPQALEITCASCGSTMQCEPAEMSGDCPFCAAKFVTQAKAADPLVAPNGVLPFAMPRQQASASVSQWLHGLWFAPGDLKKVAKPEGINGMYVPFWTYDAHAESVYQGKRGDYYYVTETVWTTNSKGERVQVQQQVRKTRWQYAEGRVSNSFDDVLIPATRSIDPKRLAKLEPWDLEKTQPYDPGFLPGFKAQRYQVELPEGLDAAKQVMQHTIHYSVCQDIGGDEQQVDRVDTDWSAITFKHLMLPVWLGAYRFQGKVFQVVINARTGEVQGERPYSVGKIVALILVILFVIWVLSVISN